MKFFKPIIIALVLITFFISCKQYNSTYFDDQIKYCKTVKQLNNAVLGNNFPPMIASRIYAYSNIAAYEVIAAYSKNYQSLAGQIKHFPKLTYADTAHVNYHYASILAFCKVGEKLTFPEGSLSVYLELLNKETEDAGMPNDVKAASKLFADSIANQIIRWSAKDNYLQLRTASKYTVTQEEGRWVPTPPMYATAVEPHWMEMRTMCMDSASQFKPQRPPLYDAKNKTSIYYKALLEVKSIADSLNDEQKNIAEFWDDNPFKMNVTGHVMYATKKFSPPGHWMNIVGIGAQKANADFDKTVAAYAHTSIAMYDAFISCWDEKYRSNLVRPQTVINKYIQSDWEPFIQTPPFPSHTSGHATVSAAAAEVMTNWFGDELSFSDTSSLEFGIKARQIVSFRKAAEEAAMSRLYGGIHYRFDNEHGTAAGKKLGEFIVSSIKLIK